MFEPFILPLAGGVMIGLAAGGLYLLLGEIAGITGILRHAMNGPGRTWQLAFIAGLLLAGAAASFSPADYAAGLEGISIPVLVVAGLLVGVGTDMGNGCTSGHGVCGLSRFSKRSLVAVVVFMLAAGITVFVTRHGGIA